MTFPWWIHADYSWFSCPSCAWEQFQDELFHQVPRDQGEADRSVDARVFLFVILEDRTFAVLQSLGSSPSCHGHSRIVKRGLTIASISSLSTYGWIPSGVMGDLWTSTLLMYSLTLSRAKMSCEMFLVGVWTQAQVLQANHCENTLIIGYGVDPSGAVMLTVNSKIELDALGSLIPYKWSSIDPCSIDWAMD